MKKNLIIFFIFLLLLLPIMSAVGFDMKEEFKQGETLMAKVSGNFLDPILKQNIFFYRDHVPTSIGSYNVVKIDDEFYIYAQLLGKNPNNYSIVIKDVRYMDMGKIIEEEIVRSFIITNITADFSINPGFIITNENFYIEAQNFQDFEITINIDANKTETLGGFFSSLANNVNGKSSVTLNPGETKKINFELGDTTTFRLVGLSTENLEYEIPVYAFVSEIDIPEDGETENRTEETENRTEETEETTPEEEEEVIISATTKTCEELEGKVCDYNKEECEGELQYAKDSKCCLGTCKEIEENVVRKIIGWVILIVVLAFLIWFFKKKRKTKKKIDLFKISRGKP